VLSLSLSLRSRSAALVNAAYDCTDFVAIAGRAGLARALQSLVVGLGIQCVCLDLACSQGGVSVLQGFKAHHVFGATTKTNEVGAKSLDWISVSQGRDSLFLSLVPARPKECHAIFSPKNPSCVSILVSLSLTELLYPCFIQVLFVHARRLTSRSRIQC
jgi:hypothetical protein